VGNSAATDILEEAGRQVGGEKDIHGNVDNSYSMVAQMWEVYLRHSNYQRHNNPSSSYLKIDAIDVLELMSILKKCRHVYSPTVNRENFVDDAGYVTLAGMIAMPKQQQLEHSDVDVSIRTIAGTLRPRVKASE
jgi:hypothetical protein